MWGNGLADRLFLTPDRYLVRTPDHRGPASGQYAGFMLHGNVADVDLGLYALRFRAKDPIAALAPDPALSGQTGAVGYFRLFYPTGINLYGASFSTEWGGNTIAGEVSDRHNMPLVGYDARIPQLSAPTRVPYYARGDHPAHARFPWSPRSPKHPSWDGGADAGSGDRHRPYPGPCRHGLHRIFPRFALKARARIETPLFPGIA